MTTRQRTVLAIAVAVVSYAAFLAGLVLEHQTEVAANGRLELLSYLDSVLFSFAWVGFPAVGAVLAVRRPANPVGWSILAVGAAMYVPWPATDWAQLVVARGGEPTAVMVGVAACANALSVVPIVAFALVLLQFPNGEVTGPSRFLTRLVLIAGIATVVVRALRPAPLDGLPYDNPFGVEALPPGESLVVPLTATLFAVALVALVRLVVRYRRATGLERKQFQWVIAAVATFPVVWMLGNVLEGVNYWVGQLMTVGAFDLAFLGFTIGLHRAITRHDLYGIDRLVSRTLTYAIVTALLAGAYLGLAVGLGAVARGVTGESGDLVVALSTLAVAALFRPLRRRVHGAVDRRFNRRSYDATQTIDAFGRALRDQVSRDAIAADLRAVASRTFGASVTGVVLVGSEP